MSIKCKVIWLAVVVVSLLSCGRRNQGAKSEKQEVEFEESFPTDTLQQQEEELGINEEVSSALDGVFNDFLFAYLHSRTLRRERTAHPLRLEHTTRPTEMLEEFVVVDDPVVLQVFAHPVHKRPLLRVRHVLPNHCQQVQVAPVRIPAARFAR